MTEPTTKQIQERHDKERGWSLTDVSQVYADRGILLKRLKRKDEILDSIRTRSQEFQNRLCKAEQKLKDMEAGRSVGGAV